MLYRMHNTRGTLCVHTALEAIQSIGNICIALFRIYYQLISTFLNSKIIEYARRDMHSRDMHYC